ncbi:MAG: hypothetical protein LBV72_16180, partial [Tannerella sp.]|nr:hypothetical protein [Tannerella sp.]
FTRDIYHYFQRWKPTESSGEVKLLFYIVHKKDCPVDNPFYVIKQIFSQASLIQKKSKACFGSFKTTCNLPYAYNNFQ